MASNYYFSQKGQTFGPVSSQELRRLAEQGFLAPTDLVLKEGLNKWVAARSAGGLFPPGKPASPPSPTGPLIGPCLLSQPASPPSPTGPLIGPCLLSQPASPPVPAPPAAEIVDVRPTMREPTTSQSPPLTADLVGSPSRVHTPSPDVTIPSDAATMPYLEKSQEATAVAVVADPASPWLRCAGCHLVMQTSSLCDGRCPDCAQAPLKLHSSTRLRVRWKLLAGAIGATAFGAAVIMGVRFGARPQPAITSAVAAANSAGGMLDPLPQTPPKGPIANATQDCLLLARGLMDEFSRDYSKLEIACDLAAAYCELRGDVPTALALGASLHSRSERTMLHRRIAEVLANQKKIAETRAIIDRMEDKTERAITLARAARILAKQGEGKVAREWIDECIEFVKTADKDQLRSLEFEALPTVLAAGRMMDVDLSAVVVKAIWPRKTEREKQDLTRGAIAAEMAILAARTSVPAAMPLVAELTHYNGDYALFEIGKAASEEEGLQCMVLLTRRKSWRDIDLLLAICKAKKTDAKSARDLADVLMNHRTTTVERDMGLQAMSLWFAEQGHIEYATDAALKISTDNLDSSVEALTAIVPLEWSRKNTKEAKDLLARAMDMSVKSRQPRIWQMIGRRYVQLNGLEATLQASRNLGVGESARSHFLVGAAYGLAQPLKPLN